MEQSNSTQNPLPVLNHHVSGVIARGEAQAIVGIPAAWPSICADLSKADTREKLNRVEQRATRLYNAGLLTVSQLKHIDVRVMELLAKL